MAVLDAFLELINEVAPGQVFKYNKFYVGLQRNGIVDNFVTLRIRKDFVIVEFRIPRTDEMNALLDEAGVDRLEYDKRFNRYRIRIAKPDLAKHRDLLIDLIRRANGTPAPD